MARDVSDWHSFTDLANEILAGFDEGRTITEQYVLLRLVEPLCVAELGERSYPHCQMKLENGEMVLLTTHPYLDLTYEAKWDSSRTLSESEEAELRGHIVDVLNAWKRESARRSKDPNGIDAQYAIRMLFDDWLPRADAWLTSEADEPLNCLLLRYRVGKDAKSKGWKDLPIQYQQRFPENSFSWVRFGPNEMIGISTIRPVGRWDAMFAAIGKYTDELVVFASDERFIHSLDNKLRWIFRLFAFVEFGEMDVDVGGHRQTLDPDGPFLEFTKDNKQVPVRASFYIDQAKGTAHKMALVKSAEEFGYFAVMTDLRMATVAALNRLKPRGDQEAEPAAIANPEANKSREQDLDLERLSKWFERETKGFREEQWKEKIQRQTKSNAKQGRGRRIRSFYLDEIGGGIYYGDERTFVFKMTEAAGYCSLTKTHSDRIGKKIATEFKLHRR